MTIGKSLKRITLATILATSLILPGCKDKNSANSLQESWETQAKIENKQNSSRKNFENQWLEAKYVEHIATHSDSDEPFVNKVYFFMPPYNKNSTQNESEKEYLPYIGRINAQGREGNYINRIAMQNKSETGSPYVQLKSINKQIRLTPQINEGNEIAEFFVRMKYIDPKRGFRFELTGDKEFKEIYDRMKLSGKCINFGDFEKKLGEDGTIEESSWKGRLFARKYTKTFDSQFDCFFLKINSEQELNARAELVGGFEGRANISKFFEILPRPVLVSQVQSSTFSDSYTAYFIDIWGGKTPRSQEYYSRNRDYAINNGKLYAPKEKINQAIDRWYNIKEIATIDKEK